MTKDISAKNYDMFRRKFVFAGACASGVLGINYVINSEKLPNMYHFNKYALIHYGKSPYMPNRLAISMLHHVRTQMIFNERPMDYYEKYNFGHTFINCLEKSTIKEIFQTEGLEGLNGLVTDGDSFEFITQEHPFIYLSNPNDERKGFRSKTKTGLNKDIEPNESMQQHLLSECYPCIQGGISFTDPYNAAQYLFVRKNSDENENGTEDGHKYWRYLIFPTNAKICIGPNGKGQTSEFLFATPCEIPMWNPNKMKRKEYDTLLYELMIKSYYGRRNVPAIRSLIANV